MKPAPNALVSKVDSVRAGRVLRLRTYLDPYFAAVECLAGSIIVGRSSGLLAETLLISQHSICLAPIMADAS